MSEVLKGVLRILSGYTLAIICLSLLFILTWLSTLEQPEKGLFAVQERYYSADNYFVTPDLDFIPKVRGNSICPPIPSAYLVSIVLFINLTLGGLIRIRKNWRKWGVIVSHFSMVGLLLAGFVSHHWSREGIMLVHQGDTIDYAQSYTDYTIEVAKYVDGVKQKPYVVPADELMDMEVDDTLDVSIPPLGLKLEVSNWMKNSELKSIPNNVPIVLRSPLHPQAEQNLAACKIMLHRDGAKPALYQLHAQLGEQRIMINENTYIGVQLVKEIWKMPFAIRLDKSIGEYHPNTERPRHFESVVAKLGGDDSENESSYTIKMNEPLRHGGYTLYQARWIADAVRPQSGFAVVKNPSDQWPKYCLYLSILGLTAHFGMQLFQYLSRRNLK